MIKWTPKFKVLKKNSFLICFGQAKTPWIPDLIRSAHVPLSRHSLKAERGLAPVFRDLLLGTLMLNMRIVLVPMQFGLVPMQFGPDLDHGPLSFGQIPLTKFSVLVDTKKHFYFSR